LNQKHYNNLRKIFQSNFTANKSRIKFLAVLIISIIDVATVRLSRISLKIQSKSKHQSNYRNLQRFFQKFKFNYEEYARFIISTLPKDSKFYLVVDRTNWKFGRTAINILMLSIIYKNNSIPLIWEMLDKGGSSSTLERKTILQKAITILRKDRIQALLGDREFIGIKWFKYLLDEDIEFHIRIPKQIKQGSVLKTHRRTINRLFRFLPEMGKLDYPKPVNILGFKLFVSGMKSKNNEYCVVVSSKSNLDSLEKYQKRWTIENMFGAFKSKGFNFEDTHFKNLEKIKKLIAIVSIAYFWSLLIGLWLDADVKIKIKKHGRKAISFFRYGFDYLCYIIKNILVKVDEFNILTQILSCT
jgi:hypothetical protein